MDGEQRITDVLRERLIATKKRAYEDFGSAYLSVIPDLEQSASAERLFITAKMQQEWRTPVELPMTAAMKTAAKPAAAAASVQAVSSAKPQPKRAATAVAASSDGSVVDDAMDAQLAVAPPPAAAAAAATASTTSSLGDAATSVVRSVIDADNVAKEEKARSTRPPEVEDASRALALIPGGGGSVNAALIALGVGDGARAPTLGQPDWHAPWKLMRVISGHLGWVRSVAVDVSNEWFATGSADRTIKIWDLASGQLKLTLTGHISTVRGVAVSARHPYLFSCGDDKSIRCWDLEVNKTIRNYHGHLSGVYCIALHPTLDILATGGRDSCVRVWDMRTKAEVFCLSGHTSTVASLLTESTDPQIISGSHDSTIRLYDLRQGKTQMTLTHHKKSVRALVQHPREHAFVSGAPDNLKHFKLPEGKFLKSYSGHRAVINTVALNRDNVLVSGGDNGSMRFWDYQTGYCFQEVQTRVQPGSLESEAGIFASTFDRTGSRFITVEADKTIKVWKEDESATPETHPIDSSWNPNAIRKA